MLNLAPKPKAFSDTSALISNPDLVILADTSAAHLAETLRKPAWILNRYDTYFDGLKIEQIYPGTQAKLFTGKKTLGNLGVVLDLIEKDPESLAQ